MRDWWLRTLLVLQRPRPVFVALREDDPDVAAERSEPDHLIVWLAGPPDASPPDGGPRRGRHAARRR
jgi:hypothetical protein